MNKPTRIIITYPVPVQLVLVAKVEWRFCSFHCHLEM